MRCRIQQFVSLAILVQLFFLPTRALACACCSNPGDYLVGFVKVDSTNLSVIKDIRFGDTANLYLTEADLEDSAKGLSQPAETYSLKGSFVSSAWKLIFREGNESGTLSLPLPVKMMSYAADIRDGRTSAGGGPLLYKEWRFEGVVGGTGIFRNGIINPTKYFLVLQGRGNGCDNATDFTHWRLQISGRKADYAFYGTLVAQK